MEQQAKKLGFDISDPEIRDWLMQTFTATEAAKTFYTTANALATMRCRGVGPNYMKLGGKVIYRRIDWITWEQSGMIF